MAEALVGYYAKEPCECGGDRLTVCLDTPPKTVCGLCWKDEFGNLVTFHVTDGGYEFGFLKEIDPVEMRAEIDRRLAGDQSK